VALVERRAMGGDCLNVGCVPSKALIRAAHAAHAVREAARFGVHAALERIDFAAVMARVRQLRLDISPHDSVARFTSLGVDVFLGEARFGSRETVTVGNATLRFARAVIATGGRPVLPPVPGLQAAQPHTNETIFEIERQPSRLLVIGGGPVGCELAQAFQRLGTAVTLVQRGGMLLTREAADASGLVQAALEADGVRVLLSSEVMTVEPGPPHRVSVRTPMGVETHDVDAILVSAGRVPNVEDLGLDQAGVTATARGVEVNEFLQTANPHIYAAGDVCLPQAFTHAADASARAVVQNALFFGRKRVPMSAIPRCTYTDPEVAHVGETPGPGRPIETYEVRWADVDRARIDGEGVGGVRVHARGGRIVGGTVVGRDAGDLIGEMAVLVAKQVGLSSLAGIVHPYPTRAEAIRRAGDLYNRTRLTPTTRTIFDRFLAWRR
jgi:pyruvate/2-oxoglutarate dehydrogenase complex dihydrolipoamide dehydrogenase (E3) component